MDPAQRRDRRRAEELAAIGHWYIPWVHLLAPTSVGLMIIIAAARSLDDVAPWAWATVPIVLLLASAAEWRIHRDMLHARVFFAPYLYDQHTVMHHQVYHYEDMAIRDVRELKLILIPATGVVLLLLAIVPVGLAIRAWVHTDVGILYIISTVSFVLFYEWLHLSHHLKISTRIPILSWLAQHHAIHHDPRLMMRWNMNVAFPLWDFVRGTRVASVEEGVRRNAERSG